MTGMLIALEFPPLYLYFLRSLTDQVHLDHHSFSCIVTQSIKPFKSGFLEEMYLVLRAHFIFIYYFILFRIVLQNSKRLCCEKHLCGFFLEQLLMCMRTTMKSRSAQQDASDDERVFCSTDTFMQAKHEARIADMLSACH